MRHSICRDECRALSRDDGAGDDDDDNDDNSMNKLPHPGMRETETNDCETGKGMYPPDHATHLF